MNSSRPRPRWSDEALPDAGSASAACSSSTTARPRSPIGRVFGTLTGGQFYANLFWVGVVGDYVAISTEGEGPSIVERVGPNRYVAFYGEAGTAVGPSNNGQLTLTRR